MADLWYRGVHVEVFLGIPRATLDPILTAAGAPSAVLAAVNKYTEREPLHVRLIEDGYNSLVTPDILVLDVASVQIDAGLNEVPQAVVEAAVGRDAVSLAEGATSAEAVSVAHYIERYLGKYVPVRIYARRTVTAGEGASDGDFDPPGAGEWVCLFDGLTVGPTRRGTAGDYRLAIHLTHFTAVLGYSSSLAGNVAAGTEMPYALNTLLFRSPAGAAAGQAVTTYGFVASCLAPGGNGLYTDFWGYDVAGGDLPPQGGLKKFLKTLADQDLFDWQTLARADLGGAACPDFGRRRANDAALAALSRIEPFGSQNIPVASWAAVRAAVEAQRATNTADGNALAVDRADLLARVGGTYYGVGYTYGVPIPFYSGQDQLRGALNSSVGFASDIAFATFDQLAPASFWDLLTGRYAPRYQLAFAPMADRALVIPFQPLLARSWATIAASEMLSWNDDVRNPVPIRGVVLVSQRRSDAGWVVAGVRGAAGGSPAADAAYDSCEQGVFLYRSMPGWLVHAARFPTPWANRSVLGARTSTALPDVTGALARSVVEGVLTSTPAGAGKGLLGAAAALGVAALAVTAPDDHTRSTANRMAKSLFQQSRAQPRNVYVSTRFRYDIAPGSVVTVETPSDNYVRQALGGQRESTMVGMVLRMTIVLDRERQAAETHFQIGFVRTEGEARPGSVMYSQSSPIWNTACYGAPWADSLELRGRLGNRATIDFRIPQAV